MLNGRCLCGDVTYEYDGEITEVAICHCSQCRRAQGTPFVTNAPVDTDKLRFLTGESSLKSYFASKDKRRVFCENCGSPIFSQRTDMPEVVRLRLGTLTSLVNHTPDYHIFYGSKVDWFDGVGQVPTYDENKD